MGGISARERVRLAVDHKEPDRIPFDLGGMDVTGMHVSAVYALRQALGLDKPGTPVKVIEPYTMLGNMDFDLIDALGIDVVSLWPPRTMFGFRNEGWKEWTTFDGTPVLVPEAFNTDPEPNGEILMYPEGDKSAPPRGRMPKGGWYFDAIVYQHPIDDDTLNVEDNLEEFGPISDDDLEYFRREAERLYNLTDKAICFSFGDGNFGDVAAVMATWMKHPKGIRDMEEWFISTAIRPDYIRNVFERQCEIALANLEKVYEVLGDRISIVQTSGNDFGMQTGPLTSPKAYRDLYKPFSKRINDWIHEHTLWKTFIHSCGSVVEFLDDFIEAGFDVFNPVQCSAAGMDPEKLKKQYGDRICFWGGGVDTQHTLPFGTVDEVRRQVRQRIRTFGTGGGFVFNAVHNIQAQTPTENVLAMVDEFHKCARYPL
jgi:hypothetical protein